MSRVPTSIYKKAYERTLRLEQELEELRASERDQAEKHRYWHKRYDEAGAELTRLRGEFRILQEQTGSALVHAHVARGNRELDATKLAVQVGDLANAAEDVLNMVIDMAFYENLTDNQCRRLEHLWKQVRAAKGEVGE